MSMVFCHEKGGGRGVRFGRVVMVMVLFVEMEAEAVQAALHRQVQVVLSSREQGDSAGD
jgi:hypothetical protein